MNLKNLLIALVAGAVSLSSSAEAKPASKPKALEKIVLQGPLPGNKAPPEHDCLFDSGQTRSICDFDKFGAPRDYGKRTHQGLDLNSTVGTSLYPLAPGKVIGAGRYMLKNGRKVHNSEDNGNEVRVLTNKGLEFTYIHLDQVKVKIGDKVTLKTKVGTVGLTGSAGAYKKNPHVHIQLKYTGKGKDQLLDPQVYIRFKGQKSKSHFGDNAPASIEDKLADVDILKDCAQLRKKYGMRVSPENLVYLTRLVYFEAGTDGRVTSPEFRKGLDAVIHVILNRKEFDTQYQVTSDTKVKGKWKKVVITKNKTHEKRFTEEGHLLDVVRGEGAKQFSAIAKNAPYFETSSFKDKKGRYSLAFGEALSSDPELQKRMLMSYQAVTDALRGTSHDPTNGALYYRNPKKVQTDFPKEGAKAFTQVIPKHKVGEGLEERTEYVYMLRKSVTIGNHVFYVAKVVEETTRYDNNKGTTKYTEKK